MIKSSLAVVVLVVTARAAIADPGPVADGSVPVTFAADSGRRVDISLRDGIAIGPRGGAVLFQTLCTTPCTTRLRPGRHYLVFADPEERIEGGGPFLFDGPTTIAMRARSRSGTRLGLIIGGGLIAGGGATVLATAGDDYLLAGSMVLGGGLMVMAASLLFPDTFETTQSVDRLSRSDR
jgi:hypothetical protein